MKIREEDISYRGGTSAKVYLQHLQEFHAETLKKYPNQPISEGMSRGALRRLHDFCHTAEEHL